MTKRKPPWNKRQNSSSLNQFLNKKIKFYKKYLTSTVKKTLIHLVARIAQSVEQRIENPRVGGSIPPPGTI